MSDTTNRIKAAAAMLDAQPVPTKGRRVWPPESALTDEQVRDMTEVVAISLIDGGWTGPIDGIAVERLERRIEAAIREAIGRGERG